MADKAIQDLPIVDRLEVDDLLVVGDASNGYNAHAATGAIMRILVKEQASEAVAEIESKVSEASQAATSAAGSAGAAQQYAQNATDSAEQSATSAQQSETSATDAQGYADSASEKATLSQSWAVGGTGSREGEDTDNAKYWAEQAHNAAGGGVVSFNGRTGAVVPQAGDYTPEMVGAISSVTDAIDGIIPTLTADGQLQSSGKRASDFAPAPLSVDTTLYVNAATGNDNNDGMTAYRPKKTIQAAVNTIPPDMGGHVATILLADGTYTEFVQIRSKSFGSVILRGNISNSDAVTVQNMLVVGCMGRVRLEYLNFKAEASLYDCKLVMLQFCNFHTTTQYGAILAQNTEIVLFSCNFQNQKVCAGISYAATLHAGSITGSNNIIGVSIDTSDGYPMLALISNCDWGAETEVNRSYRSIVFKDGALI